MSRYRKITPINLEEQERILSQKRPSMGEVRDTKRLNRPPLPRPPIAILLEKFALNRSGETRNMREMVTSTCFSLRGVCQYIRTFADDMENLLNSVESITPVVEGVVAGYTRSLKSKENPVIEKREAPFNMTRGETEPIEQHKSAAPPINPAPTQSTPPPFSGKMPTEEELRDFLSNPLVTTLMQTVAKNLAPKR